MREFGLLNEIFKEKDVVIDRVYVVIIRVFVIIEGIEMNVVVDIGVEVIVMSERRF